MCLQEIRAGSALQNAPEPIHASDFLGTFTNARRQFEPSAHNIVVGSPTGNRFSALFRGKVRREEKERDRELIHEGIRGLAYPLEFELDRDKEPKIQGAAGYRWGIRDMTDNALFQADDAKDYFTISVVPNILAPAYAQVPPVIMIEGCSALGTSGASLLWSSAGTRTLTVLARHVQSSKSKYWQALFSASNPTVRENVLISKEECVASHVEFERFRELGPTSELSHFSTTMREKLEADIRNLASRERGLKGIEE